MLLKKYSDFGGGKKKRFDSEFLSYNQMLNTGKNFAANKKYRVRLLSRENTDTK